MYLTKVFTPIELKCLKLAGSNTFLGTRKFIIITLHLSFEKIMVNFFYLCC